MSSINMQEYQKLKELVEVLAGLRGAKDQAAIRLSYLSKLQDLIGSLKGSTNDIQLKLEALNTQLTQTQQQIGGLTNQVNFLQADVDGLQGTVNNLQIDIGNVQNSLNDAQTELGNINDQIAEIQLDLSGLGTLTDRLNQLQADVGNVSIPAATASSASAPPTAAQYNALLTDVNALRQALIDLKNGIT